MLLALVHGNLIISVAALGLGVTSVAVLGLPVRPVPLAFVFGATFVSYTLNNLWDRTEDTANLPGRTAFVDTYGRVLLWIAGSLYLGLLVLLVSWRPWLALIGVVPPVGAWLYSSGRIKRVYILKNVFVGAVWALIPVGLGLFYRQLTTATVLLAVVIGVFLTAAAALFDIKDVRGDRLAGIDTIPTVQGAARTRRLAGLAILSNVPVILLASIAYTPRFLVLLLYVGYLLSSLPFATTDRGPLFYGLVIDGEHVVVATVAAGLWVV